MRVNKEKFEREFVCPKCHGHGALGQEVSIGRGVANVLPLPLAPNRYLAISCGLCGYTEFYQMAVLEREIEESPNLAPLIEKQEP